MAYINDLAFDAGIAYLITNGNRLHVCSQEPTSVGTLYSLGNKASITMGTAGDGTPSGRKTTVPAITDGTSTGNGMATHYAIVNTAGTILVATGAVASPQTITSGNPFTLAAFDLTITDAVGV